MMGSLQYAGAVADYRRYWMPVRFYTIAARVLHSGRYGGDAEDPRLFPQYLGYPSLVRGYDVGTFDAADCPQTPTTTCDAFDRLIGSRMLVANLELRVPLLRLFGQTSRPYGPVPVEVAAFADAGVTWSRGQSPDFFGGARKPVRSTGAALRVNVFGFSVLQLSAAHPFDRPRGGWIYQFSLTPGF